MALGLSFSSGEGGGNSQMIPFVKYDARAGRFFRNDRTEQNGTYVSNAVDITSTFKAVIDLENIEVGYLLFAAGSAPAFNLVKLGEPMPARPSDGSWKQGVRILMKLSGGCGGDLREASSNATAFLRGIDELHNAYEASKAANPGKLPVVALKTTIPVTSGSGDRKSTNYQPVFEITGWVARPADLVYSPKGASVAPAAVVPSAPATGSKQVSAPPAKAAPVAEVAVEDDFG